MDFSANITGVFIKRWPCEDREIHGGIPHEDRVIVWSDVDTAWG